MKWKTKMNKQNLIRIWESKKTSIQYGFVISCVILFFCFFNKGIFLNGLIFPGVKWSNEITLEDLSSSTTQILETKFYIEKTNYTTSYHLLCPKNTSGIQIFYGSTLTREFYRYIHLQNIYCTPQKMLATHQSLIKLYNMTTNTITFVTQQKETKCGYEHIIYLYSAWGDVFGHFMHDCLSTILKIPKELLDKSMIMISFDYNAAIQYLHYFNISKKQVLANKNYWYFAKNLYLFHPYEEGYGYIGHTYSKVIELLRIKTGANSIKGTRFVFINRPPKTWRHITNLLEFYSVTKIYLPKYPWELIENPSYKNLKNISKEFASFKFVVAPSGSNCVNMLYMNRNFTTGMCLIHADAADYPIYANALVSQIWVIGFCNYWGQWDNCDRYCDIQFGIFCINKILYALSYGSWPSDTYKYMFEAFDFPLLYKHAKENVFTSTLITYENSSLNYPINFEIAFGFQRPTPLYIK